MIALKITILGISTFQFRQRILGHPYPSKVQWALPSMIIWWYFAFFITKKNTVSLLF